MTCVVGESSTGAATVECRLTYVGEFFALEAVAASAGERALNYVGAGDDVFADVFCSGNPPTPGRGFNTDLT